MQKKKMAVIFQGLVYFGDKDPWIDPDEIRELCNVKKMRYRIIEGANHSLETGNVYRDVDIISSVIKEAGEYLG